MQAPRGSCVEDTKSEKTLKLVRKIGQKTFDKHAREAIFKTVDRLCGSLSVGASRTRGSSSVG